MKKLIHYFLIAIMLNLHVAVYAEDQPKGCKWEVIEETAEYIMENCTGEDGNFQARIRTKDLDGSVGTFVVREKDKKSSPIKEFKDKVEQTPQLADKPEKIEQIQKDIEVTEEKINKVVETKQLKQKQIIDAREEKIVQRDTDSKITVQVQEEKEWAELDKQIEKETAKIVSTTQTWRHIHEMLPALIVENEKIKAAEQDYEAAVEALKSEYSAYYPQVSISIGNNWEDDRTPAKGTHPGNTITHDSKHGVQKSITITQMIWDAGRTTAVIDKAKISAQQCKNYTYNDHGKS